MVCIYCDSPTQVTNSRFQKQANQVWRRRKCTHCSTIFTTHEQAQLTALLMVELTSKQLEPFSRDKLFIDLYTSCKHRQSALTDAAALTQTIINKLVQDAQGALVHRNAIIKASEEALARFDASAVTFYRAYHSRSTEA